MKTRQILNVLYVFSWVIFVGLCIQAGGYLTNAVFTLVKPESVRYLWHEVDLTALFSFDHRHYFGLTMLIGITTGAKAWLFFAIIRMLGSKELNFKNPFVREVQRFMTLLSMLSLLIGALSAYGRNYTQWLSAQGVPMPDTQSLILGGADVWVFMAVILFVIAQLFKRGVEIQNENELTI
nr:DUF2975 domain-containing protein [uncultured Dyadobacter sp.]